jgi:hypothetical protein
MSLAGLMIRAQVSLVGATTPAVMHGVPGGAA